MQLIATRAFYRVPAFECIEIKGAVHPKHIHKGARFTLGDFAAGDIAKKPASDEKKIAAMLIATGCAVEATPENVAKVEAEVAAEARREANAEARDAKAVQAFIAGQAVAFRAEVSRRQAALR